MVAWYSIVIILVLIITFEVHCHITHILSCHRLDTNRSHLLNTKFHTHRSLSLTHKQKPIFCWLPLSLPPWLHCDRESRLLTWIIHPQKQKNWQKIRVTGTSILYLLPHPPKRTSANLLHIKKQQVPFVKLVSLLSPEPELCFCLRTLIDLLVGISSKVIHRTQWNKIQIEIKNQNKNMSYKWHAVIFRSYMSLIDHWHFFLQVAAFCRYLAYGPLLIPAICWKATKSYCACSYMFS